MAAASIEVNNRQPLLQNSHTHLEPPPVYQSPVHQQPLHYNNAQPVVTVVSPITQGYHSTHSTVVVVNNEPEENNWYSFLSHIADLVSCFGFTMGFFFGILGLSCICCVRDHTSYLKGWAIPFVISLTCGMVVLVLWFLGVFASNNA
jgi:hypothetical protein